MLRIAAVLLCLLGVAAGNCRGETLALLVGVSGYPSLPEHRRLRGPVNDVQFMRTALRNLGVPDTHIDVLADGVAGSAALPTRAAILSALENLAQKAKPDDWVVLYFSGHGSQQPQPTPVRGYVEPDGLDEIFLPYDIGAWDGARGAVRGALVDDEIGVALARFTTRRVNVWAIFDTCHAGDMAKGGLGLFDGRVTRFVSPTALGVPDPLLDAAEAKKRQPALPMGKGMASAAPASVPGPPAANRFGPPSDRLVVFYASQPDEPAAEEPLPVPAALNAPGHAPSRRYFGLFTYLIADALPTWRGSFRQLADRVAQKYRTRPYPNPQFEGDIDRTPDIFSGPTLTPATAARPKP